MMDLERVNAYMERVKQSETQTFKPVSSKLKVGLDLGTAYIVIVVLDEELWRIPGKNRSNRLWPAVSDRGDVKVQWQGYRRQDRGCIRCR